MGEVFTLKDRQVTYCNRIKDILKGLGFREPKLTPELYAQLNTNPHEFAKWVRNEKQPSISQAAAFCKLYHIDIKDFFTTI